ncbi:6-phospho-3-hexuloisomerase [Paenibacillus thermoaerophilus]|uniref:6-phospho-3-hexuloisomerase n=1 Tax=Paenibacillus thermoaerophilus TaxID=1215385 RepID=A0ABW2V477_9BACL|nr:6-phospho-3-hexuloisomerase [Paenibacillus thermoaerophilus]TMV18150.1 6-phospho-3-hexuloisomerase [Paenibacillus thermoaerophilus]
MRTIQYVAKVLEELNRTVDFIAGDEADRLVDAILKSKKIFTAGAGRSGLMARAFAMRLMQMGFEAYVVGETVTPNLEKEDLLIIGSGSGETKSLALMAEKAKSLGAAVGVVTINPESTIGRLSDIVVKMPGSPKDKADGDYKTIQPMASLFEQTLLLLYDAVILKLMEKKGLGSGAMFARHANLE